MSKKSVIKVVNAIRNSASAAFRSYVPSLTPSNLGEFGNAILSYTPAMNEFVDVLVNRIGLTQVQQRSFRNPLKMLKTGAMPTGYTLQNIAVNPATGTQYKTCNPGGLESCAPPDVKVEYFNLNRQDKYVVQILNEELTNAFSSFENLESFIAGVMNSLYNGAEIGEYVYTKQLIGTAVNESRITTVTVNDPTATEANATAFVKQVQTYAYDFESPSVNYNRWYATKGNGTELTAWCPLENQILIIRNDILASVDVDVLALSFNMDKASFLARTVRVDNFGETNNIYAVLCDEAAIQIKDKLYRLDPFYNPDVLGWKWFLHVWQVYGFSLLTNAVAFIEEDANSLVVNNGTGSGFYTSGTSVNVAAKMGTGDVFAIWSGDTTGLASTSQTPTTITMPASNATITANTVNGKLPVTVVAYSTNVITVDVPITETDATAMQGKYVMINVSGTPEVKKITSVAAGNAGQAKITIAAPTTAPTVGSILYLPSN